MEKELLSLLLPEGLTELFEVDRTEKKDGQIHLYLSQKNEPPAGYDRSDLLSKGFFDEITVRDFPLRGKACFLHLKRRKWIHKRTGSVIFHDWNQVADGTRMTIELAAFLKGFDR
ncbi:ISAon1 family transposase N-terminal region protein [Pararcticibacter amylolyticus]|uniref:Transposase n=1 Tax=Pararcticibacter amylolyticus TaxID=2173175 RepID=A0A2U2PD32_9SPHI|nr:transposase [Pararcticibacter amylolyticus]PWG79262.1 transposase [Pararcticibacter amylolyticus]